MSNQRRTSIKCRFCGADFSGIRAARDHMTNDHPDEMAKIQASLRAIPEGEKRFQGGLGAGVGVEFRRRMGYGPRDG